MDGVQVEHFQPSPIFFYEGKTPLLQVGDSVVQVEFCSTFLRGGGAIVNWPYQPASPPARLLATVQTLISFWGMRLLGYLGIPWDTNLGIPSNDLLLRERSPTLQALLQHIKLCQGGSPGFTKKRLLRERPSSSPMRHPEARARNAWFSCGAIPILIILNTAAELVGSSLWERAIEIIVYT